MSADLWATKGETITCVRSGHPICDIARDIEKGEPRTPADFTNWQQPEPNPNIHPSAIRCTICRSAWVRSDGMTFHFGVPPFDEWR